MKNKSLIFFASFSLISCIGFGQVEDSVRTRNDKPGTPSSLRTPNSSPQNNVPVINQNRPPLQTVNNSNQQTNITNPNGSNYQQSRNTNTQKSTPSDSIIINGAYYKKPGNATDPTRTN